MINPHQITDYHRSDRQLEELIIFCMCVAGKRADTYAVKVDQFIQILAPEGSLFESIRSQSQVWLETALRAVKMGRYRDLSKGLYEIASQQLDLRTCSVHELESITGISRKTSRFFLVHSREGFESAVLDRHILHWLRELGYDAPLSTPGPTKYQQLQEIFLRECRRRHKTPAELDLEIWKKFTSSKPTIPLDLKARID